MHQQQEQLATVADTYSEMNRQPLLTYMKDKRYKKRDYQPIKENGYFYIK